MTMVATYKIIAVLAAFAALWEALSRWRVRPPERRLQLMVYGSAAFLYLGLVLVTGGVSLVASSSGHLNPQDLLLGDLIKAYFGAFCSMFLVLGTVEIGVAVAFYDPSLPLLTRWWVQALFEGPVWRLLCQRQQGAPFTTDEAEAAVRHTAAGLITVAAAVWALQVVIGATKWGSVDPVAVVIFLKALNIWLDARIRTRDPVPIIKVSKTAIGYTARVGLQ